MDATLIRGDLIEIQCLAKLTEMGFLCLTPYSGASKYDIAVDTGEEILRIQCKSGYPPKRDDGTRDLEAVCIDCTCSTVNTKVIKRHNYTSSQIDYFATYYQGQMYLIPVDECSTSKTLRFSPPNNGQKNYNKAEDYLVENMLGYLQDPDFLQQMKEYNEKMFGEEQLTTEQLQAIRKTYQCPQCGETVYTKDKLCVNCAHKNSRLVKRPTREELKQMIRTKSFISIGKQYKVSDNAIRKWCDAENLPRKKSEINKYSDEEWNQL